MWNYIDGSDATEDDIKGAYRQMCVMFHPDKFTDTTDKVRMVFMPLCCPQPGGTD